MADCKHCNGVGNYSNDEDDAEFIDCPKCGGSGEEGMNRKRFLAAFQAYFLATQEKLEHPEFQPENSILDIARQYGARTTNKEDLEYVEQAFNWDFINKAIEGK